MAESSPRLNRSIALGALEWFFEQFNQTIVMPIESAFPTVPLPRELQEVVGKTGKIFTVLRSEVETTILLDRFANELSKHDVDALPLFKELILRYRRHRASETERLTEKTFHLELTNSLESERVALDDFVNHEAFAQVENRRIPRLKDFFPVQTSESTSTEKPLARQFDEKFHMLLAPQLFFTDLSILRRKCEDRETTLAIAYLDIDDFKKLNTKYTETKVDRNVLPRFMQTLEAHVFHHGYAYRQGGDEYLVLLPSLSKDMSIRFLDELRKKLANLQYPDVDDATTVSIGLCVASPDTPFTDRELLDRANRAKNFAKNHGKNCIATYRSDYFRDTELDVVAMAPVS